MSQTSRSAPLSSQTLNHQAPSHDSPTAPRHLPSTLVTDSNNSQNQSDAPTRSRRKAAPSPLQSSFTPTSGPDNSTLARFHFSNSSVDGEPSFPPNSSRSEQEPASPRSPKAQLEDLLASERTFYRADDYSPDSDRTATRNPPAPKSADGPLRSVSDSVVPPNPGGCSQMNKFPPMAATAPPHRVNMAHAAPRTSSIDSAISSISGNKHSYKGSTDTAPGDLPDIANLIQAAGSPEAVIQYLLKEKQSQAAQNSQLWRLVDKQRAMILGLNKDLERSLKDKEKYRKKLKEYLAAQAQPPLPHSESGASGTSGVASSESVGGVQTEPSKAGNVAAIVSAGLRELHPPQDENPDSPIDVALAPYPVTPPKNVVVAQHLPGMVEAEHKMPSPSQHAFQQPGAETTSPEEKQDSERKVPEIAREIPYDVSLPPSRSLPADPPRNANTARPGSPPTNQELKTFPSPPRKAPPAPLNLRGSNTASSHLHQAVDDSESDYDDVLEVDEIPTFVDRDRGRRKTREEDDRVREVAAMKDAEMRSLSKKSAKGGSGKSTPKSRPTTPKDAVPIPDQPLPASPRQAVPISPPTAMHHFSPDSNTASLAGVLSASGGNDIRAQTVVSPPLMSPGLPVSPRPQDRGMATPLPRNPRDASHTSSVASPPLSPRGMGTFPAAVPLSPRAPRQPIPLPPGTPMSIVSPGLAFPDLPKPLNKTTAAAKSDSPTESRSTASPFPGDDSPNDGIYRGFITEEYPELLLPPNALPSIEVKVASSRLKPSRASLISPEKLHEDPVFTLAVFSRSNGRELWRVEKDSASLAQLDQKLKRDRSFSATTPDRSLFSGHAPAKVDARRIALDKYMDEVLNTPLGTACALELCRYLSRNTMEPRVDEMNQSGGINGGLPNRTGPGGRTMKSGYLTKKGKNFGGWKARFFVLDGPVFKYFEAPGGAHLGAIKLRNAQIGKQHQHADNQESDDVDDQYRHAFMILEPKRKDSSSMVRHVLCAESDRERDQWVEALLQWVDYKEFEEEPRSNGREESSASNQATALNTRKKARPQGRTTPPSEQDDGLRGVKYESTVQGEIPQGANGQMYSDTPSPPVSGNERDPISSSPPVQTSKNISAPRNAMPIQDAGAWGNKSQTSAPTSEDKKQKKRSFFGFGSKPRSSSDNHEQATNESTRSLAQIAIDKYGPIRPAFGATLAEAVRFNHPMDVNVDLPAVVYRCIEYLDAKNAASEEGIFRLSGSNVVIRALRERFNTESDVDLIKEDQYYDIHAVASLLKLYLRELPTTILTRELHLEFIAVTELHELHDKISALNFLVHRLPKPNHSLLKYLSAFLLSIITMSDVNKMTVRNVGIVFSPTLNIPAPVLNLFLQQYEGIFGAEPDNTTQSPVEVIVTAPALTPEDIRSPRRQIFQELPTPSYSQQSFSQVAPQDQYQQRVTYETGLAPMQPSYEAQPQGNRPTMAGPEYGANGAPTLAGPSYEQYAGGSSSHSGQTSRSKRRESSMFNLGMGMGPAKKSSFTQIREDQSRLVTDESFFE